MNVAMHACYTAHKYREMWHDYITTVNSKCLQDFVVGVTTIIIENTIGISIDSHLNSSIEWLYKGISKLVY